MVTAEKRDVLIVADDVAGDALATLVANTVRGVIRAIAIKAPFLAERRFDILMDVATLTGAELYSRQSGRQLDYLDIRDLGSATKVVSTADAAVIVGGGGSEQAIVSRIDALKAQLQTATNVHVRGRLEERIGKLSGGVAIICVGASSDVELKEKKARIEDALAAARAASAEGIVPGGGIALLNAVEALDGVVSEGDSNIGVSLLRRSLEEPARQNREERRRRWVSGRGCYSRTAGGGPEQEHRLQHDLGSVRGPDEVGRRRLRKSHAHCLGKCLEHRSDGTDYRDTCGQPPERGRVLGHRASLQKWEPTLQ